MIICKAMNILLVRGWVEIMTIESCITLNKVRYINTFLYHFVSWGYPFPFGGLLYKSKSQYSYTNEHKME